MCGLVGIIGDIGLPEKKAFNGMLLTDQVRGIDGTGLITVSGFNANVVSSFKKALPSHELLQYSEYATLLGNNSLKVMAGHNRHATKGDPTKHHFAHPFTHGPITLMHNGTLLNQTNLPNHAQFEVDSENIAYALSVETPEEVIGKLNGAFALVWWDARDDSINFCRNSQRPLYFMESTDGTKICWASERWMMQGFLSQERNKANDIYASPAYAKEGTHYKVIIPRTSKLNQVLEMTEVTYELYKAPVYSHPTTYRGADYNFTHNYKHVKEFATATQLDLTNVRFWLQGFIPYKTNDRSMAGKGTLIGRTASTLSCEVKVQGCSRQEYENFVKDSELLLSGTLQSLLTESGQYVNNFSAGKLDWAKYTIMIERASLADADVLTDSELVNDSLAVFVSKMSTKSRSNYLNKVEERRILEEETVAMFVDGANRLVEFNVVLTDAEAAGGCILCSLIPKRDAFHDIVWYSKTSFICGTCVDTQMR